LERPKDGLFLLNALPKDLVGSSLFKPKIDGLAFIDALDFVVLCNPRIT
jgi:hypothetical protein